VTVSDRCLTKSLPYILFERYIYILALNIVDRCILYCILFVFMLVLLCFCVATEFSVNKDLYKMARPWNQHCANCIGTLSLPVGHTRVSVDYNIRIDWLRRN